MPYARVPARIKQMIPAKHGQDLFVNVVNSQLKSGKTEAVAFASAWAALQSAGYKKDPKTNIWERVEKASGAKPLYMKRKVLNAERIVEWAKSQGIPTTLNPDDMHVTVIYSKEPFNEEYTRMAEMQGEHPMYYGGHVVRGGKRSVERLGQNGEALVLKIECPKMASEHYAFRAMGASSSDWPDYKPHITLSWQADGIDEKAIRPFEGDIVLSDIFVSLLDEDWKSRVVEKSQPTASSVHVPSTEWEKAETYRAPAGARAAAARALRWKEKYGDKVKGGTQVGWTRANQLANGENLSRETVARMASFFARHKGNEVVDPKYKDEPWRDAGHVMHLAWGGDAGAAWAKSKMEQLRKRQIDDDSFTMPDEARARSLEMGLEGRIHVEHEDGQQAVYMPGADEDEYVAALERLAGIESEDDEEEEPADERGLLERAIAAIMGAIMGNGEEIEKKYEVAFSKRDDEQRIVWGWASVSTEDGELVVDTQGDTITPVEMEKMANDFMAGVRKAKSMHEGPQIGEFIHSFPMTNELMKAFGIHSDREGWIVAAKIYDDDVWEEIKTGRMTGFSIGGRAEKREALE